MRLCYSTNVYFVAAFVVQGSFGEQVFISWTVKGQVRSEGNVMTASVSVGWW